MSDVSKDPQPYMDEGTGAYPAPPESVTVESSADVESTDAVPPPPVEVTVTSPAGENVTNPTGAVDGPPAEQTVYQWPGHASDEKPAKATKASGKKAVTADESDVENKAVQ